MKRPSSPPATQGSAAEADSGSYEAYIRSEWALFRNDPSRGAATEAAVRGLRVTRVLDIGCGAGQELRPFVRNRETLGVGVDISAEVGRTGRVLFEAEEPGSRVAFVRAPAERLPFGAATFDVVLCRLALPYTDNARALGEMARVLAPGGRLLLKFHHARYYTAELRQALAKGHVKGAIHACRVLGAGCWYHLTGRQPRGRLTGAETFQTMWLLRRELRRHGLQVQRPLPDTVPAAPSLLIEPGQRPGGA